MIGNQLRTVSACSSTRNVDRAEVLYGYLPGIKHFRPADLSSMHQACQGNG